VARTLLSAAVAEAVAGGAARIEAYPVDTDAAAEAGRRARTDDLNTGTLALFTAAGFVEVGRPTPTRPIVQLEITGATVSRP
ncbi:MAG: GNAT family N-acetyltransferase, partial [Yonghaparkia sp.]|nr:GNAT family N-acetyltransferase [Microcella sp.]